MSPTLLFFAGTLFVSAFLLFLVQPMIGKMILPRLGGTPQVWNTCMVFFQTALLAGYAYTHTVSTRLKLRTQLLVHGVLLLVPLAVLFLPALLIPPYRPFNVEILGLPPLGANPIPYTLGLLAVVVGLPFFVVSTSAPLLQRWFAHTGDPAAKDPYFLYAASNAGSLAALLLYPILLEWLLLLDMQAWTWALGYTLLVVLVIGCALMVLKAPPSVQLAGAGDGSVEIPKPAVQEKKEETGIKAGEPEKPATHVKKGKPHRQRFGKGTTAPAAHKTEHRPLEELSLSRLAEVTWLRRLRWIGLAAVPSSLMLGVTTYITTDLSPIPLFWLIPLTLYLLSFILVFSTWPVNWVETPHKIFVWAQPFVIAILIYLVLFRSGLISGLRLPIFLMVLAFFVTTMVCHGELAKDRPATRHLTEFYLWLSVGGMVGGMFNGLLAPLLFIEPIEFNLALWVGCLLRPLIPNDWIDSLISGAEKSSENSGLSWGLDIVLPIGVLILMIVLNAVASPFVRGLTTQTYLTRYLLVFGVPLVVACLFLMRPLRFGLAIGVVLLTHSIMESGTSGTRTVFSDRSYFGIIRVRESYEQVKPSTKVFEAKYRTMIHGHIDHGMNFIKPSDKKQWGDPDADLSRLATTYYHRKGPAGIVMEKFNWFPDPDSNNTFHADARMPASLIASAITPLHFGNLPTNHLTTLWSEPPYATIGLGTGTMASYARPFQHMHYYEIDNHVRRLSLPPPGKTEYFTYLKDAIARGVEIQVLMGDARLRMAIPYVTLEEARQKMGKDEKEFYAQTDEGRALREKAREMSGGPDDFYHMMVVDAFTSDAIPVHLITREALQMYFTKLTKDGILCVHTSNRYVNLVPVVADVANSIKIKTKDANGNEVEVGLRAWRGHDNAPGNERGTGNPIPIVHVGHYTSEWVMVAREDAQVVGDDGKKRHVFDVYLTEPRHYRKLSEEFFKESDGRRREPYWEPAAAYRQHIWTDDYSNLWAVMRREGRGD